MQDPLIKDELKFGTKYKINYKDLKYDRTYLAKLESSQGVYHCFAAITDKEHTLPQVSDGKPTGDFHRFPDLVIVESIKEGDFDINGLEIIVKPEAEDVLVAFEHYSTGTAPPTGHNDAMCLRLMKLLE